LLEQFSDLVDRAMTNVQLPPIQRRNFKYK